MSYYKIVNSLEVTRKLVEGGKITINELADANCEIINLRKDYPRINNYILDDSTDDYLEIQTDTSRLYSVDVENSFGVTYSSKRIADSLNELMMFIYDIYEGDVLVQEKGCVFKHKELSTSTKRVRATLKKAQ